MKTFSRILLLMISCMMLSFEDKSIPFYVGTADNSDQAAISLFDLNLSTGEIILKSKTPSTIAPGYLSISPDKKYLYSITADQKVNAYQIGKNLELTNLNNKPTEGAVPCHISVHPSGKMVYISNYIGGTFTAYGVGADGALSERLYKEQYEGKGANQRRQEKAHTHYAGTTLNGKYLYVADLGTDRLMNYNVDVKKGEITPNKNQKYLSIAPGSGPRHFVMDPSGKYLYLLNELKCTITVCAIAKDGVLTALGTYETLPKDFKGDNISAAIRLHPNGKFLYASNRGHNSISGFKILEGGKLEKVEEIKDHISTPRDFNIDPTGKYMIIGNQDKNQLVVYSVDSKTGKLTFKHESVSTPAPICVTFF